MPGKSKAQLELEAAQAAQAVPAPLGPSDPTPIAFRPAYSARAFDLALLGASQEEMAEAFGVAPSTISDWQRDHPSFALALRKGGKQADSRVARAQYRRAVGMKVKKEKALVVEGKVQVVEIVEEIPPSDAAGQHWLANRSPSKWRSAMAGNAGATFDLDALVSALDDRRRERLGQRPGDDAKPVTPQDIEIEPG